MSTTTDTPGDETDSWEAIAEERDLLEEIVEDDGPFAPEARKLLDALDADESSEGDA
ncbi:hypothetical protein [Haloparvum sedimenti]|uniref:hypothetical protein n=1 Tax=Haloparvum sedimenti TaxID=1678448 RepID=UPI00159EC4CB|nr:hypothetical protein [Haloparvum sedimenti]